MDDRIVERLEELRVEQLKGERQLEALDTQRSQLRDTLLRIAGAVRVLEELQQTPAAEPVAAE